MKKQYFTLLVFTVVACGDSKETRLQRFLVQGNAMVAEHNYSEARRYFEKAIELDSCFADAWNNLGTLYYKEGHPEDAVNAYTRAITCDESFQSALLNRANTFYDLGQYAEALEDVGNYSRARGDTTATLFLKGLAHTGLRQFDSAHLFFRRAQALATENQEIVINIANVYYLQRKFDSARVVLARAGLHVSDPHALNTLALVEAESGDLSAAMMLIKQALRRMPSNPYFINNRGYIYLKAGKLDSAALDINRALAEDRRNAWANRNKGILNLMTGDVDGAITMLSRGEALNPNVEYLTLYLGEAWLKKGDRRKACTFFSEALRKGEISNEDYERRCL